MFMFMYYIFLYLCTYYLCLCNVLFLLCTALFMFNALHYLCLRAAYSSCLCTALFMFICFVNAFVLRCSFLYTILLMFMYCTVYVYLLHCLCL